ncbi:hypothetical protein PQX77_010461 [Marasmius sp. AFHP31]|nr:hypothetical protein PQX77_010461 [Marasmius sp. AFHP31]
MVTKSYSLPLWKKRSTSGESNPEDAGESSSTSPPTATTGGVVLKLPLPSFMAKPSRSPSRTRECSRAPCLVNGTPSYFHHHHQHQRRPSNPNALPNAIQVVDTHHTHILLAPSSPSPTRTTFSESTLSSGSGSKSPLRRSPSTQFKAPSSPNNELGPSSPPSATVAASHSKDKHSKDKERERESQKIATIPLRACCPDCFSITEESLGDQWKERFSRGARRRRGSSVSSATSASESEGGQDVDPYSPMASYKPLREAVKEEAAEKEKQEDKANTHPSNANASLATSTSAVADDDELEDILVTPLSLAVRVDEVDSLKGSRFTRPPTPLTDQLDTEDESQPQHAPQESRERGRGMEREISTSSVGSSSSTFSTTSGCSSSTSHAGGSSTSLIESASSCDQSTLSDLPPSLRRAHTQPLPSSSCPSAPPTSYTMATRGKRRRKPSTPIKEDEEPPEEQYVGFCRDRIRDRGDKERGRSKRESHRLKALKIRAHEAEDDDNMLFPLPSPRRSPSISPLSESSDHQDAFKPLSTISPLQLDTPNGSLTPTNASIGGSKTPSPTSSVGASPAASSSTVHLQPNAPKKRSRLGLDSSPEGSTENASAEEVAVETTPSTTPEGPDKDPMEATEEFVLPQSITRKDREKKDIAPPPPSLAKAAEIALAETTVEPASPPLEEEEWINLRPKGSGHSKAASEPSAGSMKERPKKLSPRIPFSLSPSTSSSSSSTQQRSSPILASSTPLALNTGVRPASSSPSPSPIAKTRRKSSLRSGAGAFFDIFRGVPGITP